MILPIYAYGFQVLKKQAVNIDADHPRLDELVQNMWETMYAAKGIGLAGPQVGLGLRIFAVDTVQIMEEGKEDRGIKSVFINADILEEGGDEYLYEEGCLSIPGIRGEVARPEKIVIRYYDEQFQQHTKEFLGINARVIQHEYDHIEGILFTELLRPMKKQMIKRKLENIRKGKTPVDYRMKFNVSGKR